MRQALTVQELTTVSGGAIGSVPPDETWITVMGFVTVNHNGGLVLEPVAPLPVGPVRNRFQ